MLDFSFFGTLTTALDFKFYKLDFFFHICPKLFLFFFSSFQNAMCQFVNIVPLVSLWKFHLEIIGAEESPYILRK